MEIQEPLHPRPQFARTHWIDLRGPWGFAYDDDDYGLQDCWQEREDVFTRSIIVPFPPESQASGIGETGFHSVVWYRRTFQFEPDDASKRLILNCGAIDYRAQVWVNGQHVTTHEGGHTSFSADITSMLRPSSEQVIVIRAEDRASDLAQPRGKQDWQEDPHGIWYHRTTGIWQPIWLEPVGSNYITELRWTPDVERGVLGMLVGIRRREDLPLRIRVQLSLHGALIVDDIAMVHGAELQREFLLDLGSMTMSRSQVLWSPDSPNLVEATLSVLSEDEVLDEIHSYSGLRNVRVSGGRFLLNGRPYYLRLALEQGYWPESHLAAPSDEALRREVELAKELGFNGLRIHQKIEDPRFLYWCDRLGLMVWGEMANAYVFTRRSVERLTREWLEALVRDYSHPCIVAWVPINESWGVPNLLEDKAQQHYVQTMYHLTKSLDPTRPVIGNDGWEYLVGDIFGIHDYTFHGDTLRGRYGTTERIEHTVREVQPGYRFVTLSGERQRDVPVMLTEFGGISYRPSAGIKWFGYGTVQSHDDYRDKYEELIEGVLNCPSIAGFCYTQLTDTGQERNGLLTENREPKLDPAFIRAVNQRPSSAVPGDVINQVRRVRGTGFAGTAAPDDIEYSSDSG